MEMTVGQIAALVNGIVEGDSNVKINGYSKIEEGKEGCLTFMANTKYAFVDELKKQVKSTDT